MRQFDLGLDPPSELADGCHLLLSRSGLEPFDVEGSQLIPVRFQSSYRLASDLGHGMVVRNLKNLFRVLVLQIGLAHQDGFHDLLTFRKNGGIHLTTGKDEFFASEAIVQQRHTIDGACLVVTGPCAVAMATYVIEPESSLEMFMGDFRA